MSLPLDNIRVVEICQVFAGPFAAMLLADQGANVIKVEPFEGDSSRETVPYMPDTKGMSLRYITFNRNKRSIVVDFTKPKGLELVYDLLRQADVLVINMRTGARQRRHLTYEDVAAINPRLIYASNTGYGEDGPEADLPGIDIVTQARSGDLDVRRLGGGPPPPHTQLYHFDMAAAMLLVYAVALAIIERERTGRGQKVDTSLLQASLACHTVNLTRLGDSTTGYGIVPTVPATYRCSDGRYILVMTGGERWDRFCHTMGLENLSKDPAFDTNAKRTQKATELREILSRVFATKPAAEWEALLKADGHTTSVVKEMNEVYQDPQVVANQMVTQFEQPGIGTIRVTNVPIQMSASAHEQRFRRPAPTLGEHTMEVLKEMGRSPKDIAVLKQEKVIP